MTPLSADTNRYRRQSALLVACCWFGSILVHVAAVDIRDLVGKPEYVRCQLMYSWEDLLIGYKEREISFITGGLGHLITDREYVSWVCVRDHYCATGPDPHFCFVYNEINRSFVPWGENSKLRLVEAPETSCVCNESALAHASPAPNPASDYMPGVVAVCAADYYSETGRGGVSIPPCLPCPPNSTSQWNSVDITSCVCKQDFIGPRGGPCEPGYTSCYSQSCAGYRECWVEKNSLGNSVPLEDPRRVYLDATYYKIDETFNSRGVWRSPVNNGTRLCLGTFWSVWDIMPWDRACSVGWGKRDGYIDQGLVNTGFWLDLEKTGNVRYGTFRCRF